MIISGLKTQYMENPLGLGNGQYVVFTVNPVMTDSDGKELPWHRYQKNDSKFVKPGISGEKKWIAQLEVEYQDGRGESILWRFFG